MIAYLKSGTIRNIVSPYGLAAVSYLIFLLAWLFPPRLYTEYIGEPNLMFLDPLTFLFYTSCVIAFVLGVRFTGVWRASAQPEPYAEAPDSPLAYLALPIALLTIPCAILMILAGTRLNAVVLLASQQGQAIKAATEAAMPAPEWAKYQTFLMAVLWWGLSRASQLKLAGFSKLCFHAVFALGASVNLLACVAEVDRADLMPITAGLLVVYLHLASTARNVSLTRLLLTGVASILALISTFLALSFLRGANLLRLFVVSLMGYTIVSYNRLAAILHGTMHYAYEGRGIYLASVLSHVGWMEPLTRIFGWPSANVVWRSEFTSTYMAGLSPLFIWSGAFGYLYSDIGWWTLLYLFAVGIVSGVTWSQFTAGKTLGLVLYPWVAFCILFWVGYNMLFDTRVFRLLGIGIVLSLYDQLLFRRRSYSCRLTPSSGLADEGALKSITTHFGASS
jgi:hypothetical protein